MRGRTTKLLRRATNRVSDARGIPRLELGKGFYANRASKSKKGKPGLTIRASNPRKHFERATRKGLTGMSHKARRRAYAALRILLRKPRPEKGSTVVVTKAADGHKIGFGS